MENIKRARNGSMEVSDRFVVVTAGIGLLLSTLDTGIMNVAVPTLVAIFHSTISVIAWTITLYTLALTGSIIIFGRLSDRFGRLRIYMAGLVLFAAASILCGLALSPTELIVFRTIQGMGAAMLQATAVAIITTAIPKERQGIALGTLGMLMGLGPVLGPSIGGALLSFGGWQWIFWINIPFSIVGLIGCRSLVKHIREEHHFIHLDVGGNLLLPISVLALLQGLSMWPIAGISSVSTTFPLVLFVVLFLSFVIWELRAVQPVIDLKLFRRGDFTASIFAIFVFGGASSLGFIVPPYFLESVEHLSTWQVGLVNLSAPIGLILLSKVSGRWMGKWGMKRLMIAGLFIMLIAYGGLGRMQADWSPWMLGLLLFLYGVGGGIFLPCNIAAIMGSSGKEMQGTAGAVQRMVQNLGIAVYTAIAAAFIRAHSFGGLNGWMIGFRACWNFAAGTILLSILLFVLTGAAAFRSPSKPS